MKPRTPIQAETRWTRGFSSAAEALSPILCRNDVKVNAKKKRTEKDNATAMKTGVDGPGLDNNKEGAFPGRTVRSNISVSVIAISNCNVTYYMKRILWVTCSSDLLNYEAGNTILQSC